MLKLVFILSFILAPYAKNILHRQFLALVGACGEAPPFWCEPALFGNDCLGGYRPRTEHADMRRAKDDTKCDGGFNHWPPHICSYHMRHREYYGETILITVFL